MLKKLFYIADHRVGEWCLRRRPSAVCLPGNMPVKIGGAAPAVPGNWGLPDKEAAPYRPQKIYRSASGHTFKRLGYLGRAGKQFALWNRCEWNERHRQQARNLPISLFRACQSRGGGATTFAGQRRRGFRTLLTRRGGRACQIGALREDSCTKSIFSRRRGTWLPPLR
jgi:hypothetical protein